VGRKAQGKVLQVSRENACAPALGNGFAGTAFAAYNAHHNLVLSPDHVWVAITTAFANYVDRNAEEMRDYFVNFDGKKQIVVRGVGTITTADYDSLISQISDQVDRNTKDDVREWLECDFTTTSKLDRTVSKVVLMGAMKHYFNYKISLLCGLPSVTLKGTLEDWKEVRRRVDRIGTYGRKDLDQWAEVLGFVLDEFVNAYQGKVDKDFWNRIAHERSGGSGPTYLGGWILAFIPFTDSGDFVLNPLAEIKRTHKYGEMDTNDVPPSAVEVPVTIDDNGTMYQTIFYAGALMNLYDAKNNRIEPALDWAMIDVTNASSKIEL
jgi:hypothetical protein